MSSKTISNIIGEHYPLDKNGLEEFIESVIPEIQEIINECKPGSAYVGYDDNPQELHENRLYNSGIDQYQSNLEKRLK